MSSPCIIQEAMWREILFNKQPSLCITEKRLYAPKNAKKIEAHNEKVVELCFYTESHHNSHVTTTDTARNARSIQQGLSNLQGFFKWLKGKYLLYMGNDFLINFSRKTLHCAKAWSPQYFKPHNTMLNAKSSKMWVTKVNKKQKPKGLLNRFRNIQLR